MASPLNLSKESKRLDRFPSYVRNRLFPEQENSFKNGFTIYFETGTSTETHLQLFSFLSYYKSTN